MQGPARPSAVQQAAVRARPSGRHLVVLSAQSPVRRRHRRHRRHPATNRTRRRQGRWRRVVPGGRSSAGWGITLTPLPLGGAPPDNDRQARRSYAPLVPPEDGSQCANSEPERNDRPRWPFPVGRCERRRIVPCFRRLAALVGSANVSARDPQRLLGRLRENGGAERVQARRVIFRLERAHRVGASRHGQYGPQGPPQPEEAQPQYGGGGAAQYRGAWLSR